LETAFRPVEFLDFGAQVAAGVAALHRRGLVHRDVKSANVLMFRGTDNRLTCKLTDFGAARDLDTTSTMTVVGAAPYLDPMVMQTGRFSRGSDVFSLGVVLVELMIGRPAAMRRGSRRHKRTLWQCFSQHFVVDKGSVAEFLASFAEKPGRWPDPSRLGPLVVLIKGMFTQTGETRSLTRPTAAAVAHFLRAAGEAEVREVTPSQPPTEERLCSICMDDPVTARMRPCCHAILCEACAEQIVGALCPLCRETVEFFDVGRWGEDFVAA